MTGLVWALRRALGALIDAVTRRLPALAEWIDPSPPEDL